LPELTALTESNILTTNNNKTYHQCIIPLSCSTSCKIWHQKTWFCRNSRVISSATAAFNLVWDIYNYI